MTRQRPTASDVPQTRTDQQPSLVLGDERGAPDGLSHAQARALRRCTPLTHADLEAHRPEPVLEVPAASHGGTGG